MGASVKFHNGSPDTLDILAIPFGGIRGRDLDGEYFSPRTDLCLDWFPHSRPLLYDHGLEAKTSVAVIGRVDSTTAVKGDDGWWVQAQLDRNSQYYEQIRTLVERGALHGSSGAMPHLTQKARSGEILRWPWVEQSLTPTPSNPLSIVNLSEAAKHYKAATIAFDVADVLDKARELTPNWLAGAGRESKAGRVLSAANEAKIRHALADLEAVITALG